MSKFKRAPHPEPVLCINCDKPINAMNVAYYRALQERLGRTPLNPRRCWPCLMKELGGYVDEDWSRFERMQRLWIDDERTEADVP